MELTKIIHEGVERLPHYTVFIECPNCKGEVRLEMYYTDKLNRAKRYYMRFIIDHWNEFTELIDGKVHVNYDVAILDNRKGEVYCSLRDTYHDGDDYEYDEYYGNEEF